MTRAIGFLLIGLSVLFTACFLPTESPLAPKPVTDEATLVQGNHVFALDLYSRLRAQDGNLFFSPLSISTALAMTSAGARGETAAQMAQTLHFSLDPDRLHPAFAGLIRGLQDIDQKGGCQLSMSNALWGQRGHRFLPDFVKLARNNYRASPNEVDFSGQTETARRTINGWVEKETRNKIKELLKPGVVGQDTRLVLTNAVYFKGDWQHQFKKNATKTEPFLVTPTRKVDASLMHQTAQFQYLDGEDFQALELPYRGKRLSMVVLLPRKVDGLADFEQSLTAAKLSDWLEKLQPHEVAVTLPKLRMTQQCNLKEVLALMGMPLAFSFGADFSGMTGSTDLFLSEVVHQAFVDVNEEGTEAAAATGVVMTLSAAPLPPKSVSFRADHPFVYLIRDTHSGSILFMGRVADPQ